MDNNKKIKIISEHLREIMIILGLDIDNNDSLKKSPQRVAKMYVNEIFYGLDKSNFPKIMTINNSQSINYKQLLIEKNIPLNSFCEHHFLPVIGVVHIAYIPNNKIIGLSKLNRIVDFLSRKPHLQERLTEEIYHKLYKILETKSIAVYIEAEHMCVSIRGVQHRGTSTISSKFGGEFEGNEKKLEFLTSIKG